MTLKVPTNSVNSVQGVPLSVTGIAQVIDPQATRITDEFVSLSILSLFLPHFVPPLQPTIRILWFFISKTPLFLYIYQWHTRSEKYDTQREMK